MSRGSPLARALYRLWARFKTASRGLEAGSLHDGVPDDRLMARLSVYQWAAQGIGDRRVLDLVGGGGYGEAALLSAGAREVLSGAGAGEASLSDRGAKIDAVLAIDDPVRGRRLDLTTEVMTKLAVRMTAGGRLLLATGPWAGDEGAGPALFEAAESLRPLFLRCRRFVHRPPPGYRPDWSDRSPARARSQEYRFEEVDPESGRRLSADDGEAGRRDLAAEDSQIGELWVLSSPRPALPEGPLRLHVGAGMERMEGWWNVDLLPLPGVDLELDVTRDFPFRDVDAIYAEHFLEHLDVLDAIEFLLRAREALAGRGRLRLSTPNLDWVWRTHYRVEGEAATKVRDALRLNRAFYGWEHRFLWNRETLELVLDACGYEEVEWPGYGESRFRHLRGLERHERYPDEEELPHVLIVEASPGAFDSDKLARLRGRMEKQLIAQTRGWFGVDLAVSTSTPRVTDSPPGDDGEP